MAPCGCNLRNNRDIMVVDADKNLGDCIVDRSLVERHLEDLLAEGFQQISTPELKQGSEDAREATDILCKVASAIC